MVFSRLKTFFVIASFLALSACSQLSIAYSFVDTYLTSTAKDYLKLDNKKQSLLNQGISDLKDWHQADMLPEYAAFLEGLAIRAEFGLWNKDKFSQDFETFRKLLDDTASGAAPYIAAILSNHMSESDLAYMEKVMAEKLSEAREEFAKTSPEDWISERVERRADFLARFIGKPTADQLAIISTHSTNDADRYERWLENRALREKAFLESLRSNPNQTELTDFLFTILREAEKITDAEYKEISLARWQKIENMYFEIVTSLSEEQTDKLVKNLKAYASDLRDIAQDAQQS